MGREIIAAGLPHREFIANATEGFEAYRAAVEPCTLAWAERETGVSAEMIRTMAHAYARAERAMICWTLGITEHHNGVDNVLALANLSLLTGHVGRYGSGLNPLRGQNNVQGGGDMGALPDRLPGFQHVENDPLRAKFDRAWGVAVPPEKGWHLSQMFEAMQRGALRALYVVGENPLATLPACMEVRAALDRLELLVVQDPFLTETGQMAHVVLPATTSAEKDGTFTNLEGRVLRVRQGMDAIGESVPDWQILTALANGMGCQWEYESANDIQSEIMKLLPGYYNLGQPKKLAPSADRYLSNGYAASVAGRYKTARSEKPGPFTLLMGQLLYHSGKLSTLAPGLIKVAPNTGRIRMNAADMERLGLQDGAVVKLTSDRGSLQIGVQVDQSVAPQTCFFPEHFNEPPVKDLMSVHVDAITGVPSFKRTGVTIEKV